MESSHLEAIRSRSPLQSTLAELSAAKVMAESLAHTLQTQSEIDVKELAALRLGTRLSCFTFFQYLFSILNLTEPNLA